MRLHCHLCLHLAKILMYYLNLLEFNMMFLSDIVILMCCVACKSASLLGLHYVALKCQSASVDFAILKPIGLATRNIGL